MPSLFLPLATFHLDVNGFSYRFFKHYQWARVGLCRYASRSFPYLKPSLLFMHKIKVKRFRWYFFGFCVRTTNDWYDNLSTLKWARHSLYRMTHLFLECVNVSLFGVHIWVIRTFTHTNNTAMKFFSSDLFYGWRAQAFFDEIYAICLNCEYGRSHHTRIWPFASIKYCCCCCCDGSEFSSRFRHWLAGPWWWLRWCHYPANLCIACENS